MQTDRQLEAFRQTGRGRQVEADGSFISKEDIVCIEITYKAEFRD